MSAGASAELVSQDTKTCPDIETAYQDAKTNMNTAFEAFKVIEALVAEKGAHSALTQDLNEAFAKFEHANKIFDGISEVRCHERFVQDNLNIDIPNLPKPVLVRRVAGEQVSVYDPFQFRSEDIGSVRRLPWQHSTAASSESGRVWELSNINKQI